MNAQTEEFDSDALHALVCDAAVHRDIYTSESLFELERKRFFSRTWQYLAHASEIPNVGDFVTKEVLGQSLIVMRAAADDIRVMYNRCAHKGAKLYTCGSGHAHKFIKCPYHAWTYKLDGSLISVPLRAGYDPDVYKDQVSQLRLSQVHKVEIYRDFLFVQLAPGPGFHEYFGHSLAELDAMADSSPTGKLKVLGAPILSTMNCNWKIYLENVNDAVHAVSTHDSVGQAAKLVHDKYLGTPGHESLTIDQLLPFGSTYSYFNEIGARVFPNGHNVLGTRASMFSTAIFPQAYVDDLTAAYGAPRAAEVLQNPPQNVVFYPSLAIKRIPGVLRVIRPVSAARTIVEIWAMQPEGAPDEVGRRALSYARNAFSPMSMVAADDVHIFESIQRALEDEGRPWLSLHRGWSEAEQELQLERDINGTDEYLMRGQYRTWLRFMTEASS